MACASDFHFCVLASCFYSLAAPCRTTDVFSPTISAGSSFPPPSLWGLLFSACSSSFSSSPPRYVHHFALHHWLCFTLLCITLLCITLLCITLLCVTLLCITLRCITFGSHHFASHHFCFASLCFASAFVLCIIVASLCFASRCFASPGFASLYWRVPPSSRLVGLAYLSHRA